ncbi:uncharacterized protein LOC122011142 [Zingiber officinale]|uniref:DUF674 family protein n=1 Tax=Zingiber officinale TaxID=94328 RepID=A0A8J5KQE4_ZINOF|nr:uncharacterized protein LOC122011142 [Zingiber officinale]KAG6487684.1 hypothetical protein ZIOFF_056277 [Zingiber officinale]
MATLKVFVNKTKNCVAFVESDLDFVDVLLSFLTLPVGTVVRLLNKQSSLGCVDKLYQGVERLDEKYLATAACKSMLTKPVNSSGFKCQKLKINIYGKGELYTCTSEVCSYRALSYYSNLECHCGSAMHRAISYDLNQDCDNYEELHGVFIKGVKFAVTDDLSVSLIGHAMSSLNDCCNGDWRNMEERLVKIDKSQVLHILKRSLVSDTPLTDVLLHNGKDICPKFSVPSSVEKTVAIEAFDKEKKIYRIKLALAGNKVLYAEAGQDFVDVIFSILTFPLGALKKHMGSRFKIACLNNLYGSVERLASSGYVVEGCEETLLNPKLPPYFNCKHQVIGVAVEKEKFYYACDYRCKLSSTRYHCSSPGHSGRKAKRALLIDPKTSSEGLDFPEGSFCKELTYMVSDELVVTPFSFTSVISLHRQISDPIKIAELVIDKEEALDLLDAALSSSTALTDAFFARANAALGLIDEKDE